jgi:hypothetical protein
MLVLIQIIAIPGRSERFYRSWIKAERPNLVLMAPRRLC